MDPADFSDAGEETVAAKQAAELGMSEVHQEAEHADSFVVAREFGIGATEDMLASQLGEAVALVAQLLSREWDAVLGSFHVTTQGWNSLGVPLALSGLDGSNDGVPLGVWIGGRVESALLVASRLAATTSVAPGVGLLVNTIKLS